MMGVFIAGMDVPGGCKACDLAYHDGTEMVCPFDGVPYVDSYVERDETCPLDDSLEYTMNGYDVRALLIFSETCRKAGITEYELKSFVNNVDMIVQIVTEIQMEQFEESIKRAFGELPKGRGDKND